ncbi:MAG: glycosyltransferase family 39 protein [Anaerolineae bacterium]
MSSPPRRPRSTADPILFWLIWLIAAGLRFFRIGQQSFWSDEGNSAAMTGRSLAEISARAAADIHPPGYYWLLNVWSKLFGDSEIALRALSALWGLLLVWLVFQIVLRLFDRRTAWIAAFFVAINPFLIYYSQEARMYAQLAALAALLFYGLVRFVLHESIVLPADGSGRSISFSRPATILLVLAGLGGLYTHYTFPALIAVATLLYLFWIFNSRRRGFVQVRLLHWGLLLMVMAFFFLPWARTAITQLTQWPRSGQTASWSAGFAQMLDTLALGPATPITPTSLWLTPFLGLFILGLWPWARSRGRRAHWLSWGLPLLWLTAPMLLVWLGGLYKPAYLKFLLVGAAPFIILLSRGITGFMTALERGQWWRARATAPAGEQAAPTANTVGRLLAVLWLLLALALVIVPSARTLSAYYFDPAVARDDYRSAAAYINAVAGPNDAIILNAPGQREVFDYYYQGPLPVYGMPEQRPPDEAATVQRLQQIAAEHPQLYVLYWGANESDPNQIIESWLGKHAYKAEDRWQGTMRFVIYATQQATDQWPVQSSDVLLGEQIRLMRYALSSNAIASGNVLQLQMIWRAQRQPDADYTVFVQLLDPRDQVVAQRDAPPGSGESPTSSWQVDSEIVDNHGLLIPAGTPPGEYRLIAGLYNSTSGERLSSGTQNYIQLGVLRVDQPVSPLPVAALHMQNAKSFKFDEITLLGHDRYKRGFAFNPDEPLHKNDLLHLTFYWRADVQPTTAWWFTARLVSGADTEVAAVSGPLVSDLYPTLNWQAGEIVRGEHDLLIPDYVEPGRYQLQIFLHTGNPSDGIDRVNLGWVTVSK